KMTIEAIIIDGAENRKTLLTKEKLEDERVLARPASRYADIDRKNIFFGTPLAQPSRPAKPSTPELDKRILILTSITATTTACQAEFEDRSEPAQCRYDQEAPGKPVKAFQHVNQPLPDGSKWKPRNGTFDFLPLKPAQVIKIDHDAILFRVGE